MYSPASPLRIALTGGVASGKSTVARLFAHRGVPVIDTDRIARELVEPGAPAIEEIRAAFGPGVLDDAGRLNRRRMRARVFADPAQRRQLETILHPHIMRVVEERSRAAGAPYVLVVVPLLAETGLSARFDRVLAVDCPETLQIERLMSRDGESRARAEAMLAAQASRAERLAIADDVIENEAGEETLSGQVELLDARYRALSRGCSNRP